MAHISDSCEAEAFILLISHLPLYFSLFIKSFMCIHPTCNHCCFKMGDAHFLPSCKRHAHLFSFLVLLFSSQMKGSLVEGSRQFVEISEVAMEGESETTVIERAMIGSRPPRCEEKCSSCGHCEAVQVPIAPQEKVKRMVGDFPTTINSKDECSSNYKPMNWKCKCGGLILNP